VVEVKHQGLNETRFAETVSRHIGSKHHVLTTNPEDSDAMLPLAIWLHDEPLYHENSIPILQISLLAKHQVTVLLSGEGADELFGGYANQLQLRTIKRLRRVLPPPLARLVEPFAWNIRWSKPARALQRIAAPHLADAMVMGASRMSPSALSLWGLPVGDVWASRRSIAADALRVASDPVLAHILYDQQTYLPTLLDRQDKMSMGASIESRVPFLDVPLVEATNGLAMSLRHRNGVEKWVLRQIGRRYLPDSIVARPKHAFGLPLSEWLRSSSILVRTINGLTSGHLVGAGAVPSATMNRIVNSWTAGNNTLAGLMWTLANLELWWDIFIEGRAPSADLLSSHATRMVANHPKRVTAAGVSA
jgi:asparagine synthase (glutamine-hydrolysing)